MARTELRVAIPANIYISYRFDGDFDQAPTAEEIHQKFLDAAAGCTDYGGFELDFPEFDEDFDGSGPFQITGGVAYPRAPYRHYARQIDEPTIEDMIDVTDEEQAP